MSGMSSDYATGQGRLEGDVSGEKVEETQDKEEVSEMPSRQEEVLSFLLTISFSSSLYKHLFQIHYDLLFVCLSLAASYVYMKEAAIKKKYGGVLPKKTPLISKVNNIVLQCLYFSLLI
jgi:hypothetical protein